MCGLEILSDGRKVQEERSGAEGKIEGRGTRRGFRPGLHVGWDGTRASTRRAVYVVSELSNHDFWRASAHCPRWSLRDGAI